ncbi:MAG: hypothetical protein AB9836_07525 [Aminipila sp.]
MSKSIKLNDNTELNVIQINGQSTYFQGANRDSLEFVFKKGDYPFDQLDSLFASTAKTSKITVTDTETTIGADGKPVTTQHVYDNYSLRISMEMKPVVITPATSTEAEVTEERVMVTMGQLTLIEKKLSDLGML